MSTHTPRILIVDDEAQNRQRAIEHLKVEGYQFIEASNGQEAITQFLAHHPDIVLLDGVMPLMDGFEACKQINQLKGEAEVPVLMVTSVEDPDAIEYAFEVGAADYILKPVNYTVLRNRLRNLLRAKQTQDHLHRSRSLLDHIVKNTPVFFYEVDRGGQVMSNEGGCPEGLGLAAGQTGVSIYECYQDKPLLIQSVREALEGQAQANVYHVGESTLSLWHAPLRDRRGEVAGAIGLGVDLNQGDWQNSAYAELQRMLQTLVGNLQGAIYRSVRNPDWELEYVSIGIQDLVGYSPADVIGNRKIKLLDLIHPEDLADFEAHIQESRRTGQRFQNSFRIRTAQGQEKWLWEQAIVVSPPEDPRIVIEGFITDISDLKQTQAHLARERNLLRSLIDNLPDYIFAKDLEGRFVITNLANTHYLGQKTDQEVIGRSDYDFYPPERADSFRKDEQTILRTEIPMLHHQAGNYSAEEDRYRWYDITKVPFHDETGALAGIVGMIREISAQKEAEQKMIQANEQLAELSRLKSHFLLTMSHELRTPLNSILNYTQLLLQGILGDLNEKQRDRLERVARNGQDLLRLIEDVLDISKIQTGKMELQLQALDFAALLQAHLPNFIQQAQAKNLSVQQDLERALPPLSADQEAVVKVLTNLMSNAVKFTQTGMVSIGAQPIPAADIAEYKFPLDIPPSSHDWILLNVQDTGIGIAEETKQRIFDEFRQVDGSATREYGGTGLGLAITKQLVGLMQGHLWLDSALGYGTTFYVLLPALNPSSEPAESPGPNS
jgi:PAS domain S-box-containing protein